MGEKRRITIGVLVSGITDHFTEQICKGIMLKASECNVDVIVFPGKYLDRDCNGNTDILYEYQYACVFFHATKENVDGLIIAADCIGCHTTKERMEKFVAEYADIPCVLAASKMDGYPSVGYDNRSGVREAMEYLVDRLHLTKIGMIGGSEDISDIAERKEAYLEVMERHALPVRESFYVRGDLTNRCRSAFEKILDENPDLEAVFCVNDDTAIGMYEELERRGIRPGRDISVFGFDNIVWAAKAQPPLSTIMADAGIIGEESVGLLLRMLQGEKVESISLPAKFIKRDSFQEMPALCSPEEMKRQKKSETEQSFEDIFYRCRHEKQQEEIRKTKSAYCALMNALHEVDCAHTSQEGYEKIKKYTERFLDSDMLRYADFDNMISVFSSLYDRMKQTAEERKNVPKEGQGIELGEVFQMIYQKTARCINHYIGNMMEEYEMSSYQMRLFAGDIFQFEKGNDLSYTALLGRLGWLGIENAGLYLYEKPRMHLYKEAFEAPDSLYLKAVWGNHGVGGVLSLRQKIALRDIFDTPLLGRKGEGTRVLLPIFSNEMMYGVMLCDLTDGIFKNGDFVCGQMGAAARIIALLNANEQMQQQLEESLEKLKENNIQLDTLSKSDVLTGIRNRRGFFADAQILQKECQKLGKSLLVGYVDMNNLKVINDKYGHEDGDFSLKTIAMLLKEIVSGSAGKDGIVGRIGGDEFACALCMETGQEGRQLVEQIDKRFKQFNLSSDKPYNVTVSTGVYEMEPEGALTLEEAMTLADEELYQVKKYRSKNVAK